MNSTDIKIRMQYLDLAVSKDILGAEVTISKAVASSTDIYELIHMLADQLYTKIERHITG